MTQVKDVVAMMEAFAPSALKEEWDNVGLQLGNPLQPVSKILLALTPSEKVIEEAIKKDVDMIISHHPFIFKGVKTLRADTTIGKLATTCMKNDVALFCAHTNLDVAQGGVNDVLAKHLALTNVTGLATVAEKKQFKLVVFVPLTHIEKVKKALFEAGAGQQGAYEECAWETTGHGQFKGNEDANPFLGTRGFLEKVEESRLEVLVDEAYLPKVLHALKTAHPYEEVAYDVFENLYHQRTESIGRVGAVATPLSLEAWLLQVKESLGLAHLSYTGSLKRSVRKVALCGGSATAYLKDAKHAGADVYVTGDVKYHDAQLAEELDIALVDVSHFAGEQPVLFMLKNRLEEYFSNELEVVLSEDEKDFIQHL